MNKGELDDFDKLADKGGFITCMYYGYIFITSDSPTSGKRFSVGVVYLRGRVTNKAINKMKEFLEYLVDEHGKTLGNFRVWTNYKADQGRSDKEQKVIDRGLSQKAKNILATIPLIHYPNKKKN